MNPMRHGSEITSIAGSSTQQHHGRLERALSGQPIELVGVGQPALALQKLRVIPMTARRIAVADFHVERSNLEETLKGLGATHRGTPRPCYLDHRGEGCD